MGMTGWAQIHGLHVDLHPERIRCDEYSVEHFFMWLDRLTIMLRTVGAVVRAIFLNDRLSVEASAAHPTTVAPTQTPIVVNTAQPQQ